MNSKQFKLLIGAFFIICGLGVYLVTRDRVSWQEAGREMGAKVFPDFPLNDVAGLTIQGPTNTLNLAKSGGVWTVPDRGDYPANFDTISDLLRKVWDLKVLRPLKVGPSQLGSLELTQPGEGANSGTRLVFKDQAGQELHTLLLGKQHVSESGQSSPFGGGSFPTGRYVLADGRADSVALVQEPFSSVATGASAWLQRDFFKVEKIKSIAVTTTNSWKASRETETGEWRLADAQEGETLDTAKTGSFNYALSSPSFEDVLTTSLADAGVASPQRIVIETFDGFTYTIDAGKPEGQESYLLKVQVTANLAAERTPGADETPEDKERLDKEFAEKQATLKQKLAKEQAYGKWTYQVSNWTLNSVLKDRKELLKVEEPAPAPITPLLEPFPDDEDDLN
jgi:hypothetical protein